MAKPELEVDEVLKQLASEAVKQGENLRAGVRELTLQGLQSRELSLAQIRQVLRSVTEGVSLGASKVKGDVDKPLAEALAGMDDALLQAVHASRIALDRLTEHGVAFEDSKVKKALGELEKLEDEFLKTVRETADGANKAVKARWTSALQQMAPGATETGAQVEALMEDFSEQTRSAMRRQREAGLKVAHMLTQNFSTLASGILIGMSEGLQSGSSRPKTEKSSGT